MAQIFIDSSDLDEIKSIVSLNGTIAGITTNPSNFVKTISRTKSMNEDDLLNMYESRIKQIHEIYPDFSVSMEVYADKHTSAGEIIKQAEHIATLFPFAHVKVPIIHEGLTAVEHLAKNGVKLNLTLCFTQEQAYAVHLATSTLPRGSVYVSPFVGRLLDKKINGFSLISNIRKMYNELDSQVLILGASIRTSEQLGMAIHSGSDIVTAYPDAVSTWFADGKPQESFLESGYVEIPYKEYSEAHWSNVNIQHELTDVGLLKFATDWNNLLK